MVTALDLQYFQIVYLTYCLIFVSKKLCKTALWNSIKSTNTVIFYFSKTCCNTRYRILERWMQRTKYPLFPVLLYKLVMFPPTSVMKFVSYSSPNRCCHTTTTTTKPFVPSMWARLHEPKEIYAGSGTWISFLHSFLSSNMPSLRPLASISCRIPPFMFSSVSPALF